MKESNNNRINIYNQKDYIIDKRTNKKNYPKISYKNEEIYLKSNEIMIEDISKNQERKAERKAIKKDNTNLQLRNLLENALFSQLSDINITLLKTMKEIVIHMGKMNKKIKNHFLKLTQLH